MQYFWSAHLHQQKELQEIRWCQNDRIFKGFSDFCVGHMAWAIKGRKGQGQAGPKPAQRVAKYRTGPRGLLVFDIEISYKRFRDILFSKFFVFLVLRGWLRGSEVLIAHWAKRKTFISSSNIPSFFVFIAKKFLLHHTEYCLLVYTRTYWNISVHLSEPKI